MIYLEWITYEIVLVFAGSYSPEQMGAQVLIFTVLGFVYNIAIGVGVTLNAFVGNSIGEKDVIKTKKLLMSALVIGIVFFIPMDFVIYFCKDQISSFFTTNKEILEILDEILDIYIIAMPADCMQFLVGSYIRAIGKGDMGSICFVFWYYLIGLPLAFILGNVLHYYDRGLWIGLSIGIYCVLISFAVIVINTNLRDQVAIVNERMMKDESSLKKLTMNERIEVL